jgi:hypothetical protein
MRVSMLAVQCTATRWDRSDQDRAVSSLVQFKLACGVLCVTCAGCGCMTLASSGILLRCSACSYERHVLPSDLENVRMVSRERPAPPAANGLRQPADPFLWMPMPRQRGVR